MAINCFRDRFKAIKTCLVGLFVILLFVIPEVIFMFNSNSPRLNNYLLKKAKTFSEKSDLDKSLNYLLKVVKLNIKYNSRQYPELIPSNYFPNLNISEARDEFKQDFKEYISKIEPDSLTRAKENQVSRIFYDLGIIAFQDNQLQLIVPFFQTAIYFHPELSYYHVELANYYLSKGEMESFKEAIGFCLLFNFPKRHCQEFFEICSESEYPEKVGFMEQTINEYYSKAPKMY